MFILKMMWNLTNYFILIFCDMEATKNWINILMHFIAVKN